MDLSLPLSGPGGIWYVIPLLLTVYVGTRFLPLLLTTGFSVLIVVSYYLSSVGMDPGLALVSRSVGIGVLWIVAAVVSERNRAEEEHAQTFQQLVETNENFAALNRITMNAISTLELNELLTVLLKRLVEVMQADTAVISLREHEQLVVRASVGVEAAVQAKYSVPIGHDFAGTIAQTLQPLYIADAQTDTRVESPFIKQRGIRAMLGVPMAFALPYM